MSDSVRILQVVGGLGRGGPQSLLLNLMRHIDRDRFKFDFLVQEREPAAHDDEVEALGATIYRVPGHKNFIAYGARMRRVMRGYDVVHSHVYAYSGLIVHWASQVGIRRRIVHVHTHRRADDNPSLARRTYLGMMRRLIRSRATTLMACSAAAARSLFGSAWDTCRRCHILPNAIDLSAFTSPANGDALRSELGIPQGVRTIGQVGRFVEEKNHRFTIEVFAELVRARRDVHLVLVGEGPERPAIKRLVRERQLQDRVHFTGLRTDVPALMRGLFELMLLPSMWEGMPLVVLEAQAAGVPCLVSPVVPDDAVVIPQLVHRVAPARGSNAWATKAESMLKQGGMDSRAAVELLAETGYNAQRTARMLEGIYSSAEAAGI